MTPHRRSGDEQGGGSRLPLHLLAGLLLSLVAAGLLVPEAGAQGRQGTKARPSTTTTAATSSTSTSPSTTSPSTSSPATSTTTTSTAPSDGRPGGPGTPSSTPCPSASAPSCAGTGVTGVAPGAGSLDAPGARLGTGQQTRAGRQHGRAPRRWAGSVRPRRQGVRRPVVTRTFGGPLIRAAHSTVTPGRPAVASIGSLGSAAIDPLPVGEDEEYVGPSLRLLVPLLALSAGVLVLSAALWERRKDRRVSDARRALSSRLWHLRRRASEDVS